MLVESVEETICKALLVTSMSKKQETIHLTYPEKVQDSDQEKRKNCLPQRQIGGIGGLVSDFQGMSLKESFLSGGLAVTLVS